MYQKIKLPHKQVEWKVDLILSYYRIIVITIILHVRLENFFCFAFLLFSRRNETIPIQSRIESLLIHNLNNYCSMWAVTFGAIQLLLLLALKNCMNLIVMPRLFKELGTSAASEGLSSMFGCLR